MWTKEQASLAKQYLGTIDAATGKLLDEITFDGQLIYTIPERSCIPHREANGDLKLLPLFSYEDHTQLQRAFGHK